MFNEFSFAAVLLFGLIFLSFTFFLGIFFDLLKPKSSLLYVGSFYSFFFILILFVGVKDSADWSQYEFYFKHPLLIVDVVFSALSYLLSQLDYSFLVLYRIHIFFFAIIYPIIVMKFDVNPILPVLFLFVIQYIPVVNQLRYFLGLAFVLLALYFLYIDKNKVKFTFFFILAICSHSSTIIYLIFIVLNSIKNDFDFTIANIVFGISLLLGLGFLNSIELGILSKYFVYTGSHHLITLSGGLFTILPHLFIVMTVIFWHNQLLRKKLISTDPKLRFLYRLTLSTLLYIPISMSIQIVAHRFIHPFIFIFVIYLLYSLRYVKSIVDRYSMYIYLFVIFIILLLHKYFGLSILNGEDSETISELFRTLRSI